MSRAYDVVEGQVEMILLGGSIFVSPPDEPVLTAAQVGQTFFDRTGDWVRLLLREGWLDVGYQTGTSIWQFTLADVEAMINSLYEQERISERQARNAALTLVAISRVWEYVW